MPEMIYTPESSNVVAIGYDEPNQEVWVSFKSATYVYSEVPVFLWEQFRDSDSKGSFVHANLKNAFPTRKE